MGRRTLRASILARRASVAACAVDQAGARLIVTFRSILSAAVGGAMARAPSRAAR